MTTVLEPSAAAVATPGPTTPEPGPGPASAPPAGRRWWAFAAILAASILNILDSTLVNVAGPSIRHDLAMSTSALEWVAAAYTLALAVGLMTGARLGDMVGRKRLFLLGLAGFVATSVLCSAAWDARVLIAARALQGLCAALVLPQAFGLVRDVFPPDQIGKAFGAMGPVIGLSTVLGPVVAGLLIDADIAGSGWRSTFWVNVPIGAFALVVGARHLPSLPPAHRGLRLDPVGTMLFVAGSFLLLFPLVDGRALGWPAWVLVLPGLAIAAFAAFVAQQRLRLRAGRHPMLEPSVLRKRSYVSGVVFILVFFGCLVGFSLAVGLFLQIGLGLTPLRASFHLAAMAVGSFAGAGVGAWAATAVGRPILHVGLTVMAAGTLMLYVVTGQAGAVGFWRLAPGLAVFGLGMGMIFVPLFSIVMGGLEDGEVGSASGLLQSMEQLGASIGIAVLGTVFFDRLRIEDGGPAAAMAAGRHLAAEQQTLLWVLGGIALAWAVGWLLPRRARPPHG